MGYSQKLKDYWKKQDENCEKRYQEQKEIGRHLCEILKENYGIEKVSDKSGRKMNDMD